MLGRLAQGSALIITRLSLHAMIAACSRGNAQEQASIKELKKERRMKHTVITLGSL
jgi:hypothetical protein